MATQKTVAYKDIRSELKTGDIVLFSGKYPISWLIRTVTGKEWSHVGMVLNDMSGVGHVELWESTKPDKNIRLVSYATVFKLTL